MWKFLDMSANALIGPPSKSGLQDFPCGTVDTNLSASGGDMGLIPGLGRFHMREQLSPRATTTEPTNESPCALWNEEQLPLATARQSPSAAIKTQCNQKQTHFKKVNSSSPPLAHAWPETASNQRKVVSVMPYNFQG